MLSGLRESPSAKPTQLRPKSNWHRGGLTELYREVNKGLYVVTTNFFLLLLNCSAWVLLSLA